MTLVILAAGMGSRYGGLKQIDPITDNGEFIIDFSIYDAVQAGFDKVIFIIKEENYEIFKETVGKRVSKSIKVEYAFQKLDDIPAGYTVPEGRVKPWGTTHALLACRDILHDDFAIINSDDYYGRDAFVQLANHFKTNKKDYCMVGYRLENTLTDFGTVSRGVCVKNAEGNLESIVERTKIKKEGKGGAFLDENENWVSLPEGTIVSMNCWGMRSEDMDLIRRDFENFMASGKGAELKSECLLPGTINTMMKNNGVKVKVYSTDAQWYGVTYAEDKPHVKESLKALMDSGFYPKKLWE